jgi:hypothetical protein
MTMERHTEAEAQWRSAPHRRAHGADKPKKIEAHRRLWSGEGRGLVGLYATKAEADAVAQKGHQRFVLPPAAAWAGKDPD